MSMNVTGEDGWDDEKPTVFGFQTGNGEGYCLQDDDGDSPGAWIWTAAEDTVPVVE